MFYGILLHFICILLLLLYWTVYLSFSVWDSVDPKDWFSFYAFIMNNKVLLYCICNFTAIFGTSELAVWQQVQLLMLIEVEEWKTEQTEFMFPIQLLVIIIMNTGKLVIWQYYICPNIQSNFQAWQNFESLFQALQMWQVVVDESKLNINV